MLLKTKRLNQNAKLPTRAYVNDAGLDLYAIEDTALEYNQVSLLRTGIAIELPYGTVGLILDRGSMGSKGIKVFGGVIDSDYRGELLVGLSWISNPSEHISYKINAGDKIAQLVVLPIALPEIYEVQTFTEETQRAEKRLGSSGK